MSIAFCPECGAHRIGIDKQAHKKFCKRCGAHSAMPRVRHRKKLRETRGIMGEIRRVKL